MERTDDPDQETSRPPERMGAAWFADYLSKMYRRVAVTTVMVTAILIAALLTNRYFSQRRHVLQSAADDIEDRAISVDYQLSNAAEDIIESKIWAENYLAMAKTSPETSDLIASFRSDDNGLVVIDIPPDAEAFGSFITTSSAILNNGDLSRHFQMVSRLLEIQRINHYAPPNFTLSEFHSTLGFVSVYPKVGAEEGALILQREAARHMLERFQHNGAKTPSANSFDSNQWSDAYVDVSGRGLMITCASPVYDRGRLIGMASAEMKLAFLARFVEKADTPSGRVLIVGQRGQVIAATGMHPETMTRVLTRDEALPGFKTDPPLSANAPPGPLSYRNGVNNYLSVRLAKADWSIITVVSESDVLRAFFPEAVFGAVVIGLTFGFLLVANRVINRYFVSPAVGFVEYIETEATDGNAPTPDVPPVWQHWFVRISDILALKSVAANLPGALFQIKQEPNGPLTMTMASSGVTELLRTSPKDLVNQAPLKLDFMPPEQALDFEREISKSAADLSPFAFETVTSEPDRTRRWVRFIMRPRKLETGAIMWDGLMLDVSDLKIMEDELRRHRDHLEETVSKRTSELERVNDELIKEVAERARSENALKASEERLRVMSQQALTSQDSERARLSRELHDEIGQQLAAALFQATAIRNKPRIEPQDIARLETMLRDTGEELHRICRGLRPMTLTQFGLGPAIKMLLWEYMEIYGRDIVINIDAPDYPLTDEVAAAVYRICQEAVTNSLRHSGADAIQVSLRRDHNLVMLEITDQGKGFDLERVLAGGKLGLQGMIQRAKQCGGELIITTSPGPGARVTFKVPIEPGPEANP